MPNDQRNIPFDIVPVGRQSQSFPTPPQTSSPVSPERPDGLSRAAFWVFVCTIIIAPLSFWPSVYAPLELVKSIVITVGILLSVVLLSLVILRRKKISLPPKSLTWIGTLIVVSVIASAFAGGHAFDSFFGHGFEIGTGSFIIVTLLAGLVTWLFVSEHPERARRIYVAVASAFGVLFIFQALRLVFGTGFMSLSILAASTASIFGNWYSFGISALMVMIISLSASVFLPLSGKKRAISWITTILSALTALIISTPLIWALVALVFLGLTIYLFKIRSSSGASFFRSLSWIPVIVFLLAALFAWKGTVITTPLASGLHASYSELSLPWQMTVDVAAGSLKSSPLFGVGPNRFTQAFVAYKPSLINLTNAWSVEFNSGFSLISTYAVTQGIIGLVLWILLFIFLGIYGIRSLRRMPDDPYARFMIVSSYLATVFLWLVAIVYVPSHVLLLYTCVVTGLWLAVSSAYGCFAPWNPDLLQSRGKRYSFTALLIIVIAACALWGLWYIKDVAAFARYASGEKQLNADNDPVAADRSFSAALALDDSDLYWQARSAALLTQASMLISSITAGMSAPASQAIAASSSALINQAESYAEKAVAHDPSNYANYVSEAQVRSAAAQLKMTNGYQNAVQSYADAIQLDPQNPLLYLDLAQLQAQQNDLPNALKTVQAALQVKNNYSDAVILLSQIEAAQGDVKDAIAAAQYGTQIDSSNPVVYLDLGGLYYNNQQYDLAEQALTTAVKLQPDYANAVYFLGLSYARLGNASAAIAQFEQLASSNPQNQQVASILATLKAGGSPFVSEAPSPAAAPKKPPLLPAKAKTNTK